MKINIVITVTVAFSLCQGRHVGVYIGREGDAERALATHCDTRISNVGRNVGVKIGNVNEGNVLSWSHFHCASLRPRDYRELGANYYHKISAIKETFRLSSIMKISGDQFFYPSQIF